MIMIMMMIIIIAIRLSLIHCLIKLEIQSRNV